MSKKSKIWLAVGVFVFALIVMFSGSDKDKASASQSTEQTKPTTASEAVTASDLQEFDKAAASEVAATQLHAEDIFKFHYETPACLKRDDLQALSYHLLRKELTKASAYIFSKENPDGTCFMVDINRSYKVISAEYNDPDNPEIGLVEFVGKNVKSSKEGAWAFTSGAWKDD